MITNRIFAVILVVVAISATQFVFGSNVVGVAGPGEPLANPETFAALGQVHREHPALLKCVSTNGLLLEQSLPQLIDVGVSALTVLGSDRIQSLSVVLTDQAARDAVLPPALQGRPLQDYLVVDALERWATGQAADILSVHLALGPATRGFVGADILGRLRRGAFFINTARACSSCSRAASRSN